MAGRPRKHLIRVGRLAAQAADLEANFERIMPAACVDPPCNLTDVDPITRNWIAAYDHVVSLTECLAEIDKVLRVRMERNGLIPPSTESAPDGSAPEDEVEGQPPA